MPINRKNVFFETGKSILLIGNLKNFEYNID